MNKTEKYPPKILTKILKILLSREVEFGAIYDYEEQYCFYYEDEGKFKATFWYLFQIILAIPKFINNTFYWGFVMLKNHLKVAFRSILRNKIYSLISILGLSIGLACAILVLIFMRSELSYDRFHKNADNIYRLTTIFHKPDGSVDWIKTSVLFPHVPEMKNFFPEVVNSVRVYPYNMAVRSEKIIENETVTLTDGSFFEIFTFPLIKGNLSTVLANINSVVLTQTWAKKYFGDENPIGKTLTITFGAYSNEFTVTGIAGELPDNSTIDFNILINFETLRLFGMENRLISWNGWSDSMKGYILVQNRASADKIMNWYPEFSRQYYSRIQDYMRTQGFEEGDEPLTFGLQKLTDIHLDPTNSGSTDVLLMYVFPAGIAAVILIISCVNFITLSIGNANKRIREIGMRKVLGAQRKQLIKQFWSESIVMASLAILFGYFFTVLFLPIFNNLAQKSINITSLFSFSNILIFLSLGLIIGIIVGSYSGILMSGFKPAEIFRSKFKLSGKNIFTRILVTGQFALSVFLIVSTLILAGQINHLISNNLNFRKDNVVIIKTLTSDPEESLNMLNRYRNRLQAESGIINISAASVGLSNSRKTDWIIVNGERLDLDVSRVDYNFFRTMDIEIVEGRDFSRKHSTDNTSVIVNETLLKKLSIKDPVDKSFNYWGNINFSIIGVIKDIPIVARTYEIASEIFFTNPVLPLKYIYVKISPQDITGTLEILNSAWRNAFPDKPFSYSFLDENLKNQYSTAIRYQNVFGYSSVPAIFIACLGVLGLTSIAISRRTKEIAVRKIHGASIFSIIKILSAESVKWVIFGNLIAWPAAWFFWHKFLQSFAQRVPITPLIFVFAAVVTLLLVVVTTFYHIIKAANANPVDSLRYE